MRNSDDRWDVVVVGLRDASHAGMIEAVAEIVHMASLPRDRVEQTLRAGEELEVRVNLDRAEAERAARELHQIGIVVDLRLTHGGRNVMSVLKPDADRQVGLAVGGFLDDSATPPSVGDSSAALPELEPDPESVRIRRRHRTPPPRDDGGLSVSLGSGAGNRMPISERPVRTSGLHSDPLATLPLDSGEQDVLTLDGPPIAAQERSPRHATPAPGSIRTDELHAGSYGLVRDGAGLRGVREGERVRGSTPIPRGPTQPQPQPARRNRPPNNPTPVPRSDPRIGTGRVSTPSRGPGPAIARGRPVRRNRPPTNPPLRGGPGGPGDLPDSARAQPAAARPAPRPPGGGGPSPIGIDAGPSLAPTIDDGPTLSPATPVPKRRQQPAKPAAASAPAPGSGLELDFEAAGMTPSSKLAPAPASIEPPRPMPSLVGPPGTAGAGPSAGGKAEPTGLLELLLEDRVAWTLLTMSIALVISLVTAISVRRGEVRELLPPLEEELAGSLNDPAGVERGKKRSPAEIEGDMVDVLDDLERSFLMLWLVAGIPMGLAFSRYHLRIG